LRKNKFCDLFPSPKSIFGCCISRASKASKLIVGSVGDEDDDEKVGSLRALIEAPLNFPPDYETTNEYLMQK